MSIIKNQISNYNAFLIDEEKSAATIEKYIRDVTAFTEWLGDNELCKEEVLAYKEYLAEKYAPASANSMIIAVNGFLRFIRYNECCVKPLKVQHQIFLNEEKELTKAEYQRLVKAGHGSRLCYLIQTICATGIRVSELKFITVEAVKTGRTIVNCKNKRRVIFIPVPLQKLLKEYIKKVGIKTGSVFVTKSGKPLNRSNIWRDMKNLCKKARVNSNKVFPHNLRHLFARTFYSIEKDIVRLADLLGHSSINTTRIYTMETGDRHILKLERVQKLLIT